MTILYIWLISCVLDLQDIHSDNYRQYIFITKTQHRTKLYFNFPSKSSLKNSIWLGNFVLSLLSEYFVYLVNPCCIIQDKGVV